MELNFTKMQGAGNDFVVIDATAAPLALNTAQLQRLGDRRFGVGADQILVVEKATRPDVDFRYRIFNGANGAEVEHCGNGARCFVRYVRDHGLSAKDVVRVETVNNLLELRLQADGRVTVNMSQPRFEPASLPFKPEGLQPRAVDGYEVWPLALPKGPTVDVEIGRASCRERVS
jgi:diaminopimelate epimerase